MAQLSSFSYVYKSINVTLFPYVSIILYRKLSFDYCTIRVYTITLIYRNYNVPGGLKMTHTNAVFLFCVTFGHLVLFLLFRCSLEGKHIVSADTACVSLY